MLVDSHCHLHLLQNADKLDEVLAQARLADVEHVLSVSVDFDDALSLHAIDQGHPMVSTSVGVHPNTLRTDEPDVFRLVQRAQHPSCIAIGETGLDYYREEFGREEQQARFRRHIRAALETKKPLIIHTRESASDTLRILKEEQAHHIGGVMHCFSENWDIAQQALDLNFYISFSGIVTFKNASILHDVAQRVPSDRFLIETDSPYLAPVPYRGQPNQPAWVKYVAESIARLRQSGYEDIALQSTNNFYRCFRLTSKN